MDRRHSAAICLLKINSGERCYILKQHSISEVYHALTESAGVSYNKNAYIISQAVGRSILHRCHIHGCNTNYCIHMLNIDDLIDPKRHPRQVQAWNLKLNFKSQIKKNNCRYCPQSYEKQHRWEWTWVVLCGEIQSSGDSISKDCIESFKHLNMNLKIKISILNLFLIGIRVKRSIIGPWPLFIFNLAYQYNGLY